MPDRSTVRLNKFLADAGLASRRGADRLIQEGRVKVNGDVQREPGTQIVPGRDTVLCDGAPVAPAADSALTYVMLHKPTHVVTTVRDPQGRTTVLDLLPADLRGRRIFPVGRLDFMSEGLVLLTNDGDVTLRLTHPGFEHPKRYEVLVRGGVAEDQLRLMRHGMRLAEGEQLAPLEVRARSQGASTLLDLTLRQGLNRQIRRMCRDLELTILRLRRVDLGPLRLGDLKSGAWRHLDAGEIAALKSALGLS